MQNKCCGAPPCYYPKYQIKAASPHMTMGCNQPSYVYGNDDPKKAYDYGLQYHKSNPEVYVFIYRDNTTLGKFYNGENFRIYKCQICNEGVMHCWRPDTCGKLDTEKEKWFMDQIKEEPWKDPRPSFQDYFLTLAFIISRRSLDPRTKHGCVFVKNSRILTTGYNSPPSGYDDSKVPLTSPEKYPYFIHSEINAIANAAKEGVSLEGATCYLTGLPCSECYRAMWAAGIKEIIHAPISLEYFGEDHIARVESATKPKLICLTKEQMKSVVQMLDDTFDYLETKIDFNTPDETPAS